VLTLFCRTRAARWRARQAEGAPAFVQAVAAPALPLALLMGGVTVLFGAHGLLWPLLVSTGNDTQTAPVALFRQLSEFNLGSATGIATPLVLVVVLFLALAALQVFHLDRLVLTTGPAGELGDAAGGALVPATRPQWPGPGGYGPPPGYPGRPGPNGPPPGAYGPPPGYGPPPPAVEPPPADRSPREPGELDPPS